MNAREFLKELSGLKAKGWKAMLVVQEIKRGRKRAVILLVRGKGQKRFCPITAVCADLHRRFLNRFDEKLAGEILSLSPKLRIEIVGAADDNYGANNHIRKALLTALNL